MAFSKKTRILILGGGFAGLHAAIHLDDTLAAEILRAAVEDVWGIRPQQSAALDDVVTHQTELKQAAS